MNGFGLGLSGYPELRGHGFPGPAPVELYLFAGFGFYSQIARLLDTATVGENTTCVQ